MKGYKFTLIEIGKIKAFLDLNLPFSAIQKHFKKCGKSISKGYLSTIKNQKESNKNSINSCNNKRGRKSLLSERNLKQINKMTENPNPPTQSSMALKFNVSQQVISYNIKKRLGKRLLKKPKCHHLTANSIEKRRIRSWPLYLRLRQNRWMRFLTTDEAWFYISESGGKTRVQYRSKNEKYSSGEVFTEESHKKGIMVAAGISANGPTKAIFVEPGAKINAEYYINNVLKQYLKEAERLYPDGNFVFHQDSAPSHSAKKH